MKPSSIETPVRETALPESAIDAAPPTWRPTDIFVAVHGIGEQYRNATIQAAATQLAQAAVLKGCWTRPPVAPQPLGYFQGGDRGSATVIPIADDATGDISIGLAEVYWADVPRAVVDEGRTLEETKAWARTVVARAQALYEASGEAAATEKASSTLDRWRHELTNPDFALGAEVLDEMIETIYVLERILFLARKAGVVSVDMTGLLNNFLGDVQLVTEFAGHRREVVGRFQQTLERIYQDQNKAGNPDVRIHIIAHSEGTVVSFLGLLHALSGHRIEPQETAGARGGSSGQGTLPEWLPHVKSYLTIGSPIDKHLLLWPHLWTGLAPLPEARDVSISWKNYYDVGDPVGFRLDTARRWLESREFKAFDFMPDDDVGFSRYLIPGKAHVDYWTDNDLFEHYLATAAFPEGKKVVAPGSQARGLEAGEATESAPPPPPPPTSRLWVQVIAPVLPYLLSLAVLMLGVAVAGRVVAEYLLPTLSPEQSHLVRTELGFSPPEWSVVTWQNILGFSLLIAGVTVLARLPRLAAGLRWKFFGVLAFAVGAAAFGRLADWSVILEVGYLFSLSFTCIFVPALFWLALGCLSRVWAGVATVGVAASVAVGLTRGNWFHPMVSAEKFEFSPGNEHLLSLGGTLLLALTVAVVGLAVTRRGKNRRRRWVLIGMRPLILAGAVVVLAMVWKETLPYTGKQVRGDGLVAFEPENEDGPLQTVRNVRLTDATTLDVLADREKLRTLWWDLQALAPHIKAPGSDAKAVQTQGQGETSPNLDEKLWRLEPVLTASPPLWTVVLATLAWLYLWWLSALLFDLSFVWHRYVRREGFDQNLNRWGRVKARAVRDALTPPRDVS